MKHFLPIFRALQDAQVRYVVVGGVASLIHGVPRMTGDIDLVLDFEDQNCRRTLKVFNKLHFLPRAPVELDEFADPRKRAAWVQEKGMVVFSLHSKLFPLVMIDIFTEAPQPFESLFKNSQEVVIEECMIRVASKADLIEMKRAAGRDKDLEDIRILEQLDT